MGKIEWGKKGEGEVKKDERKEKGRREELEKYQRGKER